MTFCVAKRAELVENGQINVLKKLQKEKEGLMQLICSYCMTINEVLFYSVTLIGVLALKQLMTKNVKALLRL